MTFHYTFIFLEKIIIKNRIPRKKEMLKFLVVSLIFLILICHQTNGHFHSMGLNFKKPKSSKSISHEPGLSLKQKSWIFGKRDPMEGTDGTLQNKMGHLPEFSAKRGAEFENFQRKMLSKNEKN